MALQAVLHASDLRREAAWSVKWSVERGKEGAAELTRIGFQECRHTYRSYLNDAGIDQVRRDWYLGHADHSMAGRYEHVLPG